MRPLQGVLDSYGKQHTGLNVSNGNDYLVLAAGVAKSVVPPTGAKFILFGSTVSTDFWVDFTGADAAVPADITNHSGTVILNPGLRYIPVECTKISVIASAICTVTMEFFN